MNKEQICKWVEHFRTRSGTQIVRFRKHWHTDNPSIQGIWHPFLFKDPKINTKIFPDEELSTTYLLLVCLSQFCCINGNDIFEFEFSNKRSFKYIFILILWYHLMVEVYLSVPHTFSTHVLWQRYLVQI
jgi:hypothetical protein